MTRPEAILDVGGLSVAYGKVEAVHEVSLRVGAGEIVTVIGPNGAGKTTLLSAIMGILASTGEILFLGEYQRGHEAEHRVACGMTLVPEKRELFADMSVEDNLLLGAFQRFRSGDRTSGKRMDEIFAVFPRLRERRAQLAGTLSGGERQMLAIGRALMSQPKLLMLDEPSLGLAPLIVREIFRVITELRRSGVSILLIEQNARAALQVANYAYVLELGHLALEGPATEVAANPQVIDTYLGLGR